MRGCMILELFQFHQFFCQISKLGQEKWARTRWVRSSLCGLRLGRPRWPSPGTWASTSTLHGMLGGLSGAWTTDDAPRPGQPIDDVHKSIEEKVAACIDADPNVSFCALCREFNLPLMTMRREVKTDLSLKSLAKPKSQQLTPLQRQKRRIQCQEH